MRPRALSYASDSGAARICQRGPKQGSEAAEWGMVWERGSPLPSCLKALVNNVVDR